MFKLWQRGPELVSVTTQPLLASWDRSTDPSQMRLQRYLDNIERAFRPRLKTDDAHYLSIEVGLPDSVDILHHHDLENYLTPVAQRLRDFPVVLACATKKRGQQSRVSMGIAFPLAPPSFDGWQHVSARCTESTDKREWKANLRLRLIGSGVAVAPAGPLGMHLAWRCGGSRSWINLWKPTGDAMGPILGEPFASQPFNPSDDRIVALDLHLGRDDSLGYEVDVGAWWQPAPA